MCSRVDGDLPAYVSELVAAAGNDAHTTDARSRLGRRSESPRCGRGHASHRPAPSWSPRRTHELTVRYRLRETGMYGGAPFVEEWKPLSPRLHADVSEQHTIESAGWPWRRSRCRSTTALALTG